MSIELLNAAFKADIKPSAVKFVLVALCDYANEEGIAYPSIETLCNKTGLNRKTVIKHLSTLCDKGAIMDTGGRVGKTKSIPKYQIFLEAIPKMVLHKQAVPKVDTSKPKSGTAKQSQNRDTEPPVSLTTREPSAGQQPPEQNNTPFPLDENWEPDINQIALRTLKAAGLDDATLERERELFIAHHSIEGTQRSTARWNRSFAHTLMAKLRANQNNPMGGRNGTHQQNNTGQKDFDPGSIDDWDLPGPDEIC